MSAHSLPIKIWVLFADKGPTQSGPITSEAARLAFENAPLYGPYLKALELGGFKLDIALRWQNRVSGYIESGQIPAVVSLPGVQSVEPMPRGRRKKAPRPWPGSDTSKSAFPYRSALGKHAKPLATLPFGELQSTLAGLGLDVVRDSLAKRDVRAGAGIRVAILDADFFLGNAAFKSLRDEGRIADQYDFVAGRPNSVNPGFGDSHGAMVLSIIGGDLPGRLQGAAPAATFLLYRTENDDSESYVEEDYLAAAMERAVDSGAQVVNISLGYRYDFNSMPDFPYSDMDGRTRPSSRAVAMAARRNVLVTVSVGNEATRGTPSSPPLSAPADADSILAVGIGDLQGKACSYSSWGPTFDGRIKPDIMGLGPISCTVPVANPLRLDSITQYGGTSFSAPALAGAAILLRQAFPKATAMAIRSALMRSASLSDRPTDHQGYGIARVDRAWLLLQGDSLQVGESTGDRYAADKWIYSGAEPIWLKTLQPNAPPPQGIYDLLGHRISITTASFGDTLRIQPNQTVGHGVYVLP